MTAFKASEYCSPTSKGAVLKTGDQITALKDLHVPTAQRYQTDAKGVPNILLQSDDASCFMFTADAYGAAKPRSPKTPLQSRVLDPSVKLVQKLDGVSTPADVRALKKHDGTPLIQSSVSDDDVKAAADSIKTLVDQAHQQSGSQQLLKSFKAATKITTKLAASEGAITRDAQALSFGDFVDDLEGGWH